jgi:hypothetical protein
MPPHPPGVPQQANSPELLTVCSLPPLKRRQSRAMRSGEGRTRCCNCSWVCMSHRGGGDGRSGGGARAKSWRKLCLAAVTTAWRPEVRALWLQSGCVKVSTNSLDFSYRFSKLVHILSILYTNFQCISHLQACIALGLSPWGKTG